MIRSDYLLFQPMIVRRQTEPIIGVFSKANPDMYLGEIKWFPHWGIFAFRPEPKTVWNRQCLKDVNEQIWELEQSRMRR